MHLNFNIPKAEALSPSPNCVASHCPLYTHGHALWQCLPAYQCIYALYPLYFLSALLPLCDSQAIANAGFCYYNSRSAALPPSNPLLN